MRKNYAYYAYIWTTDWKRAEEISARLNLSVIPVLSENTFYFKTERDLKLFIKEF